METAFERRHALVPVDRDLARALLQPVLPGRAVTGLEPLGNGFCNTNVRVDIDGPPHIVVLRIFAMEADKQVALMRLVRERVATPRVLHAGTHGDLAYAVLEWMPGTILDPTAASRALGESVGRQLARLGSFNFPHAGFLDGNLEVSRPLGTMRDGFWSYYRATALEGRARARLGPLVEPLTALVETNLHYLDELPETRALVHSDFNGKNILVQNDAVTAVLDWDFAFSGPPLADLGNLLRYPPAPDFEDGVLAGFTAEGGQLPSWWRRGAKLLDLLAQCDFLDAAEEHPKRFADARALVQRMLDGWSGLPE